MKFEELLQITSSLPVFETGLLLAGDRDSRDVRRQLSRWAADGKILRLKRGLYALAPPYQKIAPHPFLVANRLVIGSYVSLQSALAYYGMIPEFVPITLSMTTRSPVSWETPLGSFRFHHIGVDRFNRYHVVEVIPSQQVYLASPEKALLDLVHLTPGGDAPDFLLELRLQNLEQIDEEGLNKMAAGLSKLERAAEEIGRLKRAEAAAYRSL
ncbi:MAG TPA: hypothetical protein VMN57_01355 [Anaerolineales bacterium]|nr:hypothetical protein [Anaerolineales bacterium]